MMSVVNFIGVPGQILYVDRVCVNLLKALSRTKLYLSESLFPIYTETFLSVWSLNFSQLLKLHTSKKGVPESMSCKCTTFKTF